MNRHQIIETLVSLLEGNKHVHAVWLEGSEASGSIDQYSDIDLCANIDNEAIDEVFMAIQGRFCIDHIHENRSESNRQLVFHISGTSKHLIVDFNAYIHGLSHATFVKGDRIDVCKVLFDKDGIIQFKDYDPDEDLEARMYWEQESKDRFSQISRVEKYCLRGLYPEALIYYHRYVIEPLVFTLRSKYTPTKLWYYMVHISQHIPTDELGRLNRVLKVSSTTDILANLPLAEDWYHELLNGK